MDKYDPNEDAPPAVNDYVLLKSGKYATVTKVSGDKVTVVESGNDVANAPKKEISLKEIDKLNRTAFGPSVPRSDAVEMPLRLEPGVKRSGTEWYDGKPMKSSAGRKRRTRRGKKATKRHHRKTRAHRRR